MDNFLKEELSIFFMILCENLLNGLQNNFTVNLSSFLNSGRAASRIDLVHYSY